MLSVHEVHKRVRGIHVILSAFSPVLRRCVSLMKFGTIHATNS